MPRRRRLVCRALGIIRSRTGRGSNLLALRSSRSRRRNSPSPKTMERGSTPSTPADRAPDCPAPDPGHHEDGRDRRRGCTGHRTDDGVGRRPSVQLGLDPQYPRLGLIEPRPWCVGVHRRPPGIPVPALRSRWPPSPCGRLSRPRTTTGAPPHPGAISRRRTCPPTALAGRRGGRPRDGSHVHHAPVDGGGAQLCPCSLATATPQAFAVAPPAFGSRPESPTRAQVGVRCCPAHIHQVGAGVP